MLLDSCCLQNFTHSQVEVPILYLKLYSNFCVAIVSLFPVFNNFNSVKYFLLLSYALLWIIILQIIL